jgi:serine acetyltransferase
MELRKYRDVVYFVVSLFFSWLYIPHFIAYIFTKNRNYINKDIDVMKEKIYIKLNYFGYLFFLLHHNVYFRVIFYHRVGPIVSLFISWYRPGCKYFIISNTTKILGGFLPVHSYSTILNAEFIGSNFSVRHLTTVGFSSGNKRPMILDNVILGANVTIIGDITIGNNVIVGAGSVVTKSVPDNCVVVGNPARIIKRNDIHVNEKL